MPSLQSHLGLTIDALRSAGPTSMPAPRPVLMRASTFALIAAFHRRPLRPLIGGGILFLRAPRPIANVAGSPSSIIRSWVGYCRASPSVAGANFINPSQRKCVYGL